MLRIGLIGVLAHHVGELSKASIRTKLTWRQASLTSPENASLDMILYLEEDQGSATVSPWRQTAHSSILMSWKAKPPSHKIDEVLQNSLTRLYGFVVGYNEAMHLVCRWIRSVVHQASLALDLRTLIIGESGTGKELVAACIHRMGTRHQSPFIPVNLSAAPRELISSQLFGFKKGSFTGALQDSAGALAAAGDGVLFLDEIGDLPLEFQPVLLRVLEQRVFSMIGSQQLIPLKAQVISATSRPLAQGIASNAFRPDLYFRLAQIVIQMPPLRERKEDIPLLVRYFLDNDQNITMEQPILESLIQYDWPGNIRELRIAVDRYRLLLSVGESPRVESLLTVASSREVSVFDSELTGTLADLRQRFEKNVIQAVLARCNGDTAQAARELGVTRRSIYNLVRRLGLELKSSKD